MRACLFSHYYTKNYIPNYVLYYLEKLKGICDQVILLTNEREISNHKVLDQLNIQCFKYENEGFDFGMYYKFFQTNTLECDQLIIANDSMVLFNDLSNIDRLINQYSDKDLLGITDSIEMKYHIQSYFWVLSKKGQEKFIEYLNDKKIIKDFGKVVQVYEVDFCSFLLGQGLSIKPFYETKNFVEGHRTNASIHCVKKLINMNIPMLKRKVLFNSFRENEKEFLRSLGYNFKEDYWQLIESKSETNLNINYLKEL